MNEPLKDVQVRHCFKCRMSTQHIVYVSEKGNAFKQCRSCGHKTVLEPKGGK